MKWLIQLQGQVVGLDTAPLIYLIEQNQAYLGLVRAFFGAVSRGEFQVVTVPISVEIAEVAAQLRARQNLRTPDAIQIATAMGEGAMFFLTNDARLAAVPDLKVLVLDAL
jgi:predicted nucleic acid-binding protein